MITESQLKERISQAPKELNNMVTNLQLDITDGNYDAALETAQTLVANITAVIIGKEMLDM